LSRCVGPVFLHPFSTIFSYRFYSQGANCVVLANCDLRTWPPFSYIIHNITVQYVVGIILLLLLYIYFRCRFSHNTHIYNMVSWWFQGIYIYIYIENETRIIIIIIIIMNLHRRPDSGCPRRHSQNGKHIHYTQYTI